jgi:hypothetical protein
MERHVRLGETVSIDTFIGLTADGEPLNRDDIQKALRYLERCYGSLRHADRNVWTIRDFDRYHKHDVDTAAWSDGGHVHRRQSTATCASCGLILALTQTTCDNCN